MFCLRSWLPLLFIPTNASPAFIVLFFISTYFLNRPCIYCSVLLFVLFISSCHWSDHCFFDLHSNWFEPRRMSSPLAPVGAGVIIDDPSSSYPRPGGAGAGAGTTPTTDAETETAVFLASAAHETARALLGAAADAARRKIQPRSSEWTGLGMEWIRSLLGRREWRLPCIDVSVRL